MSDNLLPSSGAAAGLRARVAEARQRTRTVLAPAQVAAQGGEAPKIIAFYLPQFHSIPENDAVWGDGFTEWTNVRRAQPNFKGHLQPRVPAELGYYDLRDSSVMDRQAELAAEYGVYGFCYYYYYFAGKRVLEMPLERLLETGRPAIPFCLAWANENWTETWRGRDHLLILEHHYSDEQDCAVINDLIRYFRHELYIRIDQKPLLLIYRARLIPDPLHTTSLWRQICREAGIGEIYLAMVEAADLAWANEDPARYGFDAAVEFPPHNAGASVPPPQPVYNPNFGGLVFEYDKIVEKYAAAPLPTYCRFRCITTGWDNTARRQDNPAIFINASPLAYEIWLEAVLEDAQIAKRSAERLVFVNAWNEWGEGTYLEPDTFYGRAFLEATRNALDRHSSCYRTSPIARSPSVLEVVSADGPRANMNLSTLTPASPHAGMHYLDFLGHVGTIRKPTSYFEIGTDTGLSIAKWSCDAVCVDPEFKLDVDIVGNKRRMSAYQTTSDDFFIHYDLRQHFPGGVDIAFLDGMHHSECLLRDFINTERCCHSKSIIFMHDCLPLNARMAERTYRAGEVTEGPLWAGWTGDVWRILFVLKRYRPDLSVMYLDCPPTGLVAVYNLNSKSDALQSVYQEAVDYMMSLDAVGEWLINLWQLYPLRSSNELVNRPDLLKIAFGP